MIEKQAGNVLLTLEIEGEQIITRATDLITGNEAVLKVAVSRSQQIAGAVQTYNVSAV